MVISINLQSSHVAAAFKPCRPQINLSSIKLLPWLRYQPERILMSFHDSFGYEPKGQAGGREKKELQPLKIPSDLIQVLKSLRSYAPSDRIAFKKDLLAMLQNCRALYLLRNEQREWDSGTVSYPRTTSSPPFTPAPIKQTSTRKEQRQGK